LLSECVCLVGVSKARNVQIRVKEVHKVRAGELQGLPKNNLKVFDNLITLKYNG